MRKRCDRILGAMDAIALWGKEDVIAPSGKVNTSYRSQSLKYLFSEA
ncbi:hypothetical protein H6F50_10175 [Coleofasciculus sp. FACHB-712]|nr:hypothetical protein [Coleofasciculus sp. FACHB-712]MBD1942719.1 hypothetical protein [Coleofasciculus sp. FACHB-712]